MKSLSRVRLFATPWTVTYQAPLSMGFSRQEYWSGLPFPSPGDLPDPGVEPGSPALQANALNSEPPGKPYVGVFICKKNSGEKNLGFNRSYSDGKASAYNVGDPGSILGSGRSPGEENGNPLQYYCLGNTMDRGAWWATVHGVAKSRTRLSELTSLHFSDCIKIPCGAINTVKK